jgi:hypothetical protein
LFQLKKKAAALWLVIIYLTCGNAIFHPVITHGQTDFVYFDLSNAFDIIRHALFLCKLIIYNFYHILFADDLEMYQQC